MPIELPVVWIVILNVALWPLIQLALAWAFIRMPAEWFKPPVSFESARFYEKYLGVRHWKDRLPDGGVWFGGGFAKSDMNTTDPAYLRRFIAETWRGELCHYCAFLFVPLFFLWNPWWADLIIMAYAIAANAPCIVAQRYNPNRSQTRFALMRPDS
jgi:glycosyl-4,4'-diaponeurosporenoate acyltransferase